jgi:hypothetical protein
MYKAEVVIIHDALYKSFLISYLESVPKIKL